MTKKESSLARTNPAPRSEPKERVPAFLAASGAIDTGLGMISEAADRLENALNRLSNPAPRSGDAIPDSAARGPSPSTFEHRLVLIGSHAHALSDRLHAIAARLEAVV